MKMIPVLAAVFAIALGLYLFLPGLAWQQGTQLSTEKSVTDFQSSR